MQFTEFWLPLLLGTLLRIGVPVALTVAAAWALRKLDLSWQREAEDYRARAGIGRATFELIQCWVLNDCPSEQRERCPAYRERQGPCWQHFRDERGRLTERCLGCQVFKRALAPEAR